MPTQHLIIKGKVQGVFYRVSAREQAEKMGLTGWVRNTGEGNVEIMVQGEEPGRLAAFIEWCKKGPSKAKVEAVFVEEADPLVTEGFKIIRE
jgi:acylphosphatase